MNNGRRMSPRLRLLAAALLALPVIGAGFSSTAFAQKADDKAAEAAEKKNLTLSEKVGKRAIEAQKAIEEKRYAEAQSSLNDLLRGELSPYERATLVQMLGYTYTEQDNYKKAAELYEQALSLNILPEAQQHSLMFNLAQLYLATDQFKKSIEKFKAWFAVAQNPQPEAYIAFASAYAQTDDFRSAIPLAEKAVAIAPKIRKDWYDFLAGLYGETKQYGKVVEIYEKLIPLFPGEKRYYISLSGLYSELKREGDMLAIMELANKAGHLDKSEELVNLAQLWMYHDNPYRGAVVLEAGLKNGKIKGTKENWELLANAWIASRDIEKVIDPLAKAADMANDGELYIRLAQAFVEKEDWTKAVDALEKGIGKGGLSKAGNAYLLEGVAYFNLEKLDKAERAFRKASEFPATAKTAKSWVQHIERERASEVAKLEGQGQPAKPAAPAQ